MIEQYIIINMYKIYDKNMSFFSGTILVYLTKVQRSVSEFIDYTCMITIQ